MLRALACPSRKLKPIHTTRKHVRTERSSKGSEILASILSRRWTKQKHKSAQSAPFPRLGPTALNETLICCKWALVESNAGPTLRFPTLSEECITSSRYARTLEFSPVWRTTYSCLKAPPSKGQNAQTAPDSPNSDILPRCYKNISI